MAGLEIRVNGEKASAASQPGSYATVARTWKTGDVIELVMPFTVRTEGFRDNPQRFALMHGPLVLCSEVAAGKPQPAIVADESRLPASLKPVAGRPSTFSGPPEVFRVAGDTDGCRVTLEPFYKMHGDRHYVVYWDAFTPAQWQAKEQEYQAELARQKELEARTIDVVNPGEEQNERDHGLQGERYSAGDFGGRKWRHAPDGWFSWEVQVLSGQAQELRVTYWGSDGGRVFDVLVDGEKIATQKLNHNRPDQFYDEVHPLPEKLTQGKERITVKFQAHPGNTAGGVFGVRTMRVK